MAKNAEFEQIDALLRLAKCESGFNQYSLNKNGGKYNDRGVFQINDYWHKNVSDEQAYDIEFSTKWAIDKINKGGVNIWMCSGVYSDTNYDNVI